MSTNPRTFTDKLTNFGLRFWAIVLIAALLLLAANTITAGFLAARENNAQALVANLQVLSQQLAKYTQEAVDGNAEAFTEFKATKARIDTIVSALRTGSETENVPGYEGDLNAQGVSSALQKVTETWTPMAEAADRITQSEEEVLNLADTAAQFTARVPRLAFQLDEVVRSLSDANAPASQISIANRQLVLADRMSRRVTEIVAGGENAVSAADALSRDAGVFASVLEGFRDGNAEAGYNRITSAAGIANLQAASDLYAEAQADLDIGCGAGDQARAHLETAQQVHAVLFDALCLALAQLRTAAPVAGAVAADVGEEEHALLTRDQRVALGHVPLRIDDHPVARLVTPDHTACAGEGLAASLRFQNQFHLMLLALTCRGWLPADRPAGDRCRR